MQEFRHFIKILAEVSSNILMGYFKAPVSIEQKGDGMPYTIANIKAEEAIWELINRFYPEHAILGEQLGEHNPNSNIKWIINPLNGTETFLSGVEFFGTLISVTENNSPILGAISLPAFGKTLLGDNKITTLNNRIVKIRNCKSLETATLLTSDHLKTSELYRGLNFDNLIRKVKLYRTWGDCYGYYLLATGYADAIVDPFPANQNCSALIPVVNGAGGIITDCFGKSTGDNKVIVASGATIHKKIVQILGS